MPLSAADEAVRATGIGASEAWKVVVPNGGAHDVWTRLVRPDLHDNPVNVAMRKGNALEDLAAELYAERTGFDLVRSPTLRHPKLPFVLASPDRLVGDDRGVEIKVPTVRGLADWGPDGSQEFPLKYRIQCIQQMAVTGRRVWDLSMFDTVADQVRIYPVPWDEELAALVLEQESRFWRDHVVTGIAPSADGSAAATAFLQKRYPKPEKKLRPPSIDDVHLFETGEILDGDHGLARELALVRAQMRALKARAQLLTNIAMARTGEADGVEGLWTWTLPSTGKGRTAWAKVCAAAKVPTELIAKFTAQPKRTFRLIGGDDDDNEET